MISTFMPGFCLLAPGVKWQEHNRYGQPYERACRFDNICFNAASKQFEYYLGDKGDPLFYDMKGVAHFAFPKDFVNTGNAHSGSCLS